MESLHILTKDKTECLVYICMGMSQLNHPLRRTTVGTSQPQNDFFTRLSAAICSPLKEDACLVVSVRNLSVW